MLVLVAWSAAATSISNTASVRYSIETGGSRVPANVSVNTNTVTFSVQKAPTDAVIQFRRQVGAAQASGGSAGGLAMAAIVASAAVPAIELIPVDGGSCRNPAGSFAPIPTVIGFDGAPIDKSGVATVLADSYSPGEPMIITVEDSDHDVDPSVRDFVSVTIESEGGKEREVLRMQETSASSGVAPVPTLPPSAVRCSGCGNGETTSARSWPRRQVG